MKTFGVCLQIHEIYSQISLCLRLIRRRIIYEWGGNLEMVLLDYFTLLLIRDQLDRWVHRAAPPVWRQSVSLQPSQSRNKNIPWRFSLGETTNLHAKQLFPHQWDKEKKKSRSSTKVVFKRTIKAWHMGLRVLDISNCYYGKLWQVWFFEEKGVALSFDYVDHQWGQALTFTETSKQNTIVCWVT